MEFQNSPPPSDATSKKSKSSEYVYDLYYIQPDANDIDVDDLLLDGLVRWV